MNARYRIAKGEIVEIEKPIPSASGPNKPVCRICLQPIEKKGFIIQGNFGIIDMSNPAVFSIVHGSPHIGNHIMKGEATPAEEIICMVFHFECFIQQCINIEKSENV